MLQQLQRPTEALAQYDALLKRAPTFAAARTNRGTVLKDTSRAAEAAQAYALAIRAQPSMVQAYNNLAVLAAGDLRQPQRALQLVEVGRSPRGSAMEWDTARGMALTQMRRLGEAAAAFDAARTLNPTNGDLACQLFIARMRIGDWRRWMLARETRLVLEHGGCERTWDPLFGLAVPFRVRATHSCMSSRGVSLGKGRRPRRRRGISSICERERRLHIGVAMGAGRPRR